MKIITILGARPQFIKAAVVSRQFDIAGANEIILHTGQHFDQNMSDIFFNELKIKQPTYNLSINGGGHGEMTGRMLIDIEKVVIEEKPDVMLVYGDTNSTLAGALVASKLHIPLAHVEAGLRSFNMRMPEEVNRILTDRVSSYLFTPTRQAGINLKKEGFSEDIVHYTGDVMQDATLHFDKMHQNPMATLNKYGLSANKYILATVHRAENTDHPQRMGSIFNALAEISSSVDVVLPLHPRTKLALERQNINLSTTRIKIIPPVGYLDMIALEKHSQLVVTDSGGVQKEAYFFGKSCVTMRDETEWVELVKHGWNTICPPTNKDEIVSVVMDRLGKKGTEGLELYGKGDASEKIVAKLLE